VGSAPLAPPRESAAEPPRKPSNPTGSEHETAKQAAKDNLSSSNPPATKHEREHQIHPPRTPTPASTRNQPNYSQREPTNSPRGRKLARDRAELSGSPPASSPNGAPRSNPTGTLTSAVRSSFRPPRAGARIRRSAARPARRIAAGLPHWAVKLRRAAPPSQASGRRAPLRARV